MTNALPGVLMRKHQHLSAWDGTATRGLPCLHSQRGLLNSLQWARPRASAKCDARIRKGGDFV